MINEIIAEFFDFSKPCPESVPFCEQLRSKYNEELKKLGSGCKSCQTNNIKVKYMNQVWESHIKSTIDKNVDEELRRLNRNA